MKIAVASLAAITALIAFRPHRNQLSEMRVCVIWITPSRINALCDYLTG